MWAWLKWAVTDWPTSGGATRQTIGQVKPDAVTRAAYHVLSASRSLDSRAFSLPFLTRDPSPPSSRSNDADPGSSKRKNFSEYTGTPRVASFRVPFFLLFSLFHSNLIFSSSPVFARITRHSEGKVTVSEEISFERGIYRYLDSFDVRVEGWRLLCRRGVIGDVSPGDSMACRVSNGHKRVCLLGINP